MSENNLIHKLPISVIILSFNDEQLLRPALESVFEWAGEIHVVDSGSTDRTMDIAQEFTKNVISHPFENYAAQRNWAQETLSLQYEWVFHIDADERVTAELHRSLEAFFSRPQDSINGLLVARRAIFMGRWIRYGGHYPVYHARIFRRDRGQCENRLYDQHFVVDGNVKILKGDLIDIMTTSLDTWTKRHLRWAELEAQQQITSSKQEEVHVQAQLFGSPIERRRWAKTYIFNRVPLFLRAFVYFFYRYFLRLGFLDGKEGLIFHILQGFWFRFYVDAKIWENQHSDKIKG